MGEASQSAAERHRADPGGEAEMLEIAFADFAQMLSRCADHLVLP